MGGVCFRRALLYFVCLIAVFRPAESRAELTSDFDASLGFASLTLTQGSSASLPRTLSTYTAFNFNYALNSPSINTAFLLSFDEFLTSINLGSVPYTRLGLGARWFPRGVNGSRIIFDDNSEGRLWKAMPFIEVSAGLVSLSVAAGESSYNAALLDVRPGVGFEMPLTDDWLFVTHFQYYHSLSFKPPADVAKIVTYQGFGIGFGLKLRAF